MALEGQLYPIAFLPTATVNQLGVIQIGAGLEVDSDGVVSVTPGGTLPIASSTVLGGVKVGTGLEIDGSGVLSSTGGISAVRETKTLTTSSIAPNTDLQTNLVINKTFTCLQIQTDIPARVRIYSNTTYQSADVSRPIGTDINYQTDHGLLCEVITDASYLTVKLSPITIISTIDETTTIPITVTNLSGSNSTVQVNFLIIPVE